MGKEPTDKAQAGTPVQDDQAVPIVAEDPGPADAPDSEVLIAEPIEGAKRAAPRRWRGFMALAAVLLIAALGFAAAWYDVLKLRGEDPVPALQAQVSALSDQLATSQAALTERIGAAEAKLAVLDQALADGGPVSAAEFAALAASVDALKSNVGTTALAPADAAAVRAAVDQAMADWTAAQAAAADSATQEARVKATQVDAVQRIRAAALTGAPYADALAALDGLAVDALITSRAESGLPTLEQLTDSFPDAARVALDAARRAEAGSGLGDQLANFFQTQTGARSLEPREGNDPDAILSRAEAAVKAGDVATALTELAALPDVARTEMAQWIGQAEDFQAANSALKALSATVGL